MTKVLSKISIFLINIYKYLLSPAIPKSCRFLPTCSDYGIEAINKHGAIKGIALIVKRILRCNPLGGSGFDPVPDKIEFER
ncbi:MAG: membrane protein insertion efficiency factor YidD [Sphingobacteriia bacterium]|nr:membrane protein insertion efficiency factor YidD [Sphingobacteriia bacterium]